jgi:hypothetical protein
MPLTHARDPATFAWRRAELIVVLAFSGFYVREDGKVGHADKATTFDVARARAGRLKAALESRVVQAEVLNYCRAELLDENYFHAVFEATKGSRCVFHAKVDTDSTASWTVIPRQAGHLFQGKLDT